MTAINETKSLVGILQSPRVKNIINHLAPAVFLLYFFVGISAYINWFPGSARFFHSSSISGIIVRLLLTIFLLGYALLVLISNGQRIKIKWIVVALLLLFCNGFAIIVNTHYFYLTYKTDLYGFLASTEITTGYLPLISMFLSSFSDFTIGFCFLFCFPYSFINKKGIAIICLVIVAFVLSQCFYSLVFEFGKYKAMISSDADAYSGYSVSIGAMFGDKQEFGSFLSVGFACAIFSIYLIWAKKITRILFCTFLSFILFLFLVISFLIGCKTAILSNITILIFSFFSIMIYISRKTKKAFIVFSTIFCVFLIFFLLFLSIPSFHSNGFLNDLYKMIYSRFISRIFNGIDSRNELSLIFFENANPSILFFGLSKGGVGEYMKNILPNGQSNIHTGFTYFFACYGLFGFLLYLFLIGCLLKSIRLIFNKDKIYGLILIGFFIATLIFNISECEILILSGSTAIFIFNILVVSYPKSLLIYKYELFERKHGDLYAIEI